MKLTAITAAAIAAITAPALGGGTGVRVVLFDEMIPVFGPGPLEISDPGVGDFYAGPGGMTISSTEQLYLGNGNSAGDFGGFNIEGTNGPAFLSLFSSAPGGTVTFSFDGPVSFLIDLIVTDIGITDDVICTVTTLNSGEIVDSEILTLPNPTGAPDGQILFRQWNNADTIHFQLAPNSNRVFAFDFIEWSNLDCGMGDLNQDGNLDFFDVSAYLNLFSDGCP